MKFILGMFKVIVAMIMMMMLVMMVGMFLYTKNDAKIDYDVDTAGLAVPTYDTVELDHAHLHWVHWHLIQIKMAMKIYSSRAPMVFGCMRMTAVR